MPLDVFVQNRDYVLEQAKKRFEPVLKTVFGQPAFILAEEKDNLVPGALVTVVLFLSRFTDMFGDLVEKEDYRMAGYIQRNKDGDLKIDESIFEYWRREGCLND